MKFKEYLDLHAKEQCSKCSHKEEGGSDCELCKCVRWMMRSEGHLSPEEIKVVKDDISFALGILAGLRLVETSQMKEPMNQAREALSRALDNLIVESPYRF